MAEEEVLLTPDAQADLEDILSYIQAHDSSDRAEHVYQRIKKVILSLSNFSERGRIVPELKEIGVLEYREVFFKPYRILYFIESPRVYVVAILDGRRDLDEVLHRRLFR